MIKTGVLCIFLVVFVKTEDTKCVTGNGEEGRCVLLDDCPSAVEDLKVQNQPRICSLNGTSNVRSVCCLGETAARRIRHISPENQSGCPFITLNKDPQDLKQGHKAWEKCLEYQSSTIFPCQNSASGAAERKDFCHEKVATSFGLLGESFDAYGGEFPHMAHLGFGKNLISAQFLCAGSLISHKFILTAGHCTVSREFGSVSFAAFAHSRPTDARLPEIVYGIKTITKHPQYRPPSRYHDIALLETDKQIQFTSKVMPACLHAGDVVEDSKAFATGWAPLDFTRPEAVILQNVPVRKAADESCRSAYPPRRILQRGYENTTQMCYTEDRQAPRFCSGGSGNPLQIKSKNIYCMYLILGVASFGNCLESVPGVYTRVSYYVPWIESIVWA